MIRRISLISFFVLAVVLISTLLFYSHSSQAASGFVNVDLSWIEPSDNGDSSGMKKISYYKIRYSDVQITEENFDNASVVNTYLYNPKSEQWEPKAPGETHSITLTKIPVNTINIGIKACDEVDNCSGITIFELYLSPPDPITDLQISEILANGFVLSFTPFDRERHPTAWLDIRYLKDSTQITEENFSTATQYVLGDQKLEDFDLGKVKIIGLEGDTTYAFTIKVVDVAGSSEISNSISGSTLDEVVPSIVENFSVTSVTENSVTLSWIAPSDNGNSTGTKPVSSYSLTYADKTITDITPLAPGQTQTITLTGLSQDIKSTSIKACDEVPLCSNEVTVEFSLTKPILPAANAPVVTSPIYEGDTVISGTSNANDNSLVTIFVDSKSLGTTKVTSEKWTFSSVNADLLKEGNTINATVTIDTNQDSTINSADTASQSSNTVTVTRKIEIDSTPPGIVKITDLNFTLLEDHGDETYNVTIDIKGNNITEPLRRLNVCIAPMYDNSISISKSQEFYFTPSQQSASEVWSRSLSATLASATVWMWTQAEDMSSNTAGTSCTQTPKDDEGIVVTWLSGSGKNTYYYMVSDTEATVVETDDPQAPQNEVSECSDLIDNDNDGFIDYPNDPECVSSDTSSEGTLMESEETPEEGEMPTNEGGNRTPEEGEEGMAGSRQENEEIDTTSPSTPSISNIEITNIAPGEQELFDVDILVEGKQSDDTHFIGIHVESEPYEIQFTTEKGNKKWSYNIHLSLNAGDHTLYAWAEDEAGNKSQNSEAVDFSISPDGVIEVASLVNTPQEVISELFSIISDQKTDQSTTTIGKVVEVIIDNPTVEQAVKTIVPPVVATVVVANTAAATTGPNLLAYLQYLFTSPILLIARRKRKKWGVVYHALTKKPIDLAIVRLFSRKTNTLIKTQVTDKEGRYHFIVSKGQYHITVTKPGFVFPTSYLEFKKSDVDYLDLYHGDTINITSEGEGITLNIPLDPAEKKSETMSELLSHRFFRKSQSLLAFSGVLLAFISFLISPIPILLGLLALHIFLYMLFKKLSVKKKARSWGKVYDAKTKKPLKNAVVRIFDTEFHRLLETQLSDTQGRYAFLVGNNTYYVAVEKEGYKTSTTDQINLRKTGNENIVKLDISLAPSS